MKFKSERDILVEALSAASRVVATRLIGASSGVLLSLTGNQLVVTGTDLDITAFARPLTSLESKMVHRSSRRDSSSTPCAHSKPVRSLFQAPKKRGDLSRSREILTSHFRGHRLPEVAAGQGPLTSIAALDLIARSQSSRARGRQRRRAATAHRSAVHDRQRCACDSSRPTRTAWPCATYPGRRYRWLPRSLGARPSPPRTPARRGVTRSRTPRSVSH
jgi:hypothetical protein